MRTFKPEDIKKLRPCQKYTIGYIRELWGDKEALTAQEIAALPIPLRDRGWCLFRLASDPTRRLARRISADVLDKWEAPEIVRRWIDTGDESIRLMAAEAAERAASAAEVVVLARASWTRAAWAAEWAAEAAWEAAALAAAAWAAEAALAALEEDYEKYIRLAVEEINERGEE